jgi:AcrR family transcriptional regulator
MARVTREAAAARGRQLHAATVAELARVGPTDLALTRVADRCGVTTTTLYRRHPSRHELLASVVEAHLAPVVEPWLAGAADRIADPTTGRAPSPPGDDHRAAWCQLVVAAAWSDVAATAVLPTLQDRTGTGPAGPDARRRVAELAVGSWLLARGLRRRPPSAARELAAARWFDRRPAASDAAAAAPSDPLPGLDRRGAALVAATAAVIDEVGYDAASVAAIAHRARTSTGAVYNRFSGKAGLLAAAVDATIAPRPDGDRDPEPRPSPAALVEALRTGGGEPEVAAALERTVARPLRNRTRRRKPPGDRDRPPGPGAEPGPAAVAWVATALPLGTWVVDRALARAARSTGCHTPSGARRR